MLLSLNEKEVTGCLFSVSIFLFFFVLRGIFFFFFYLFCLLSSRFSRLARASLQFFFFFQFD